MPRRKHAEGDVAVLEPKAPVISMREALRLVYAFEDVLSAVLRAKPKDKTIRKALKEIATLRELFEDRFDNAEADKALREPGSIPLAKVREELGL